MSDLFFAAEEFQEVVPIMRTSLAEGSLDPGQGSSPGHTRGACRC